MGCFSFLCKKCNKGIQSTSFSGQKCRLSLLKDGKVIQEMTGQYDSYGRVFKDGTDNDESEYWKDPTPDVPLDEYWQKDADNPDNHGYWIRVCDLMHNDDVSNGIAAWHTECDDGEVPTTRSDGDPNQGWGDDGEDFGDCSDSKYGGE